MRRRGEASPRRRPMLLWMRRLGILGGMALVLSLFAPQAALAAPRLPAPAPCAGCWHPDLNTSWQWQLSGPVDTSFDVGMYDIDGFENHASIVSGLHSGGSMVVCYISAGSWENWRPDAGRFPASVKGASNGWPGEKGLDIRRLNVLGPIMRDRVRMCAKRGYDAVEFDNVDGLSEPHRLPAHRGRPTRLQHLPRQHRPQARALGRLEERPRSDRKLLPYFDFALNEQCFQYSECGKLRAFVDAGKPVFGVEYKLDPGQFCPEANAMNFNFLQKKLRLGPWRVAWR